MEVKKLKAIEATPDTFIEYGQVIEASPDGDEFGPKDAQLDLSRGIPRFYIMHLEDRPLKFSNITHHAIVNWCLLSFISLLGVAKPPIVVKVRPKINLHFYMPPAICAVQVFRILGSKFLKLNQRTWHARPLYKAEEMDFYNLELSNTSAVDHTVHYFKKKNDVEFIVDE